MHIFCVCQLRSVRPTQAGRCNIRSTLANPNRSMAWSHLAQNQSPFLQQNCLVLAKNEGANPPGESVCVWERNTEKYKQTDGQTDEQRFKVASIQRYSTLRSYIIVCFVGLFHQNLWSKSHPKKNIPHINFWFERGDNFVYIENSNFQVYCKAIFMFLHLLQSLLPLTPWRKWRRQAMAISWSLLVKLTEHLTLI